MLDQRNAGDCPLLIVYSCRFCSELRKQRVFWSATWAPAVGEKGHLPPLKNVKLFEAWLCFDVV